MCRGTVVEKHWSTAYLVTLPKLKIDFLKIDLDCGFNGFDYSLIHEEVFQGLTKLHSGRIASRSARPTGTAAVRSTSSTGPSTSIRAQRRPLSRAISSVAPMPGSWNHTGSTRMVLCCTSTTACHYSQASMAAQTADCVWQLATSFPTWLMASNHCLCATTFAARPMSKVLI